MMKIYRIAESEYRYWTNCTASTAEKINSMTNHPSNEEVDYDEFLYSVSKDEIQSLFSQYDWDNEGGLKIEDDYAVSFYESVYENMPCCYISLYCIFYHFPSLFPHRHYLCSY